MTQDKPVVIRSGLAEIELRKPAKSIEEVELEARAHGLSYGKYLAGYRLDKELEEAAAGRQAEIRERRRAERQATRKGQGARPGRRVQRLDPKTGAVIRTYGKVKDAAAAYHTSAGSVVYHAKRYALLVKRGTPALWRYADEA